MRSPSREVYEDGVRAAKEHIRIGDAFQIVLSQRAERPTPASALALYRSLRRINPSPYFFLLELGDLALVGSSPETLVKLEGTRASLNPIAGTTDAGEGDAERLLASEKDRAEHVMLVDLGRNDLSRVCLPGGCASVASSSRSGTRTSPTSSPKLQASWPLAVGASTSCRACFPAGTVSGAPKVRAMQIIFELEGRRRGPLRGCGRLCAAPKCRRVRCSSSSTSRPATQRGLRSSSGPISARVWGLAFSPDRRWILYTQDGSEQQRHHASWKTSAEGRGRAGSQLKP